MLRTPPKESFFPWRGSIPGDSQKHRKTKSANHRRFRCSLRNWMRLGRIYFREIPMTWALKNNAFDRNLQTDSKIHPNLIDDLTVWAWIGAKVCNTCRFRINAATTSKWIFSNFICKIVLDTAEIETLKVWRSLTFQVSKLIPTLKFELWTYLSRVRDTTQRVHRHRTPQSLQVTPPCSPLTSRSATLAGPLYDVPWLSLV